VQRRRGRPGVRRRQSRCAERRRCAGTWRGAAGSCTASIDVGLPSALTADTAAAKLADLCRKIFAAAAR